MESAIGPGFCCDDSEASSEGGICCLNSTLYNLPQVQIECSQTSSWESCEYMWIICHFVGLQRVYTWGWGWYFRISHTILYEYRMYRLSIATAMLKRIFHRRHRHRRERDFGWGFRANCRRRSELKTLEGEASFDPNKNHLTQFHRRFIVETLMKGLFLVNSDCFAWCCHVFAIILGLNLAPLPRDWSTWTKNREDYVLSHFQTWGSNDCGL